MIFIFDCQCHTLVTFFLNLTYWQNDISVVVSQTKHQQEDCPETLFTQLISPICMKLFVLLVNIPMTEPSNGQ